MVKIILTNLSASVVDTNMFSSAIPITKCSHLHEKSSTGCKGYEENSMLERIITKVRKASEMKRDFLLTINVINICMRHLLEEYPAFVST